jgi:hypothetical protein
MNFCFNCSFGVKSYTYKRSDEVNACLELRLVGHTGTVLTTVYYTVHEQFITDFFSAWCKI